ncbi:MAG: peptide deformylase [Nitrospinaceae bacterium]|jgi:peptide deformylase|nr:MAG: peptide deformylase [Nitrospinaceae bacterium]
MSLLRVRNWLDPVLRKKGERIENIDENLVRLVSDMYETMLEAKGAGLAANQIGEAKSLFVVDIGIETGERNLVTVINPVITAMEDEEIAEEGCLSIPEVFAEVKRARHVELKGVDLKGNEVRYEAEGFLARAFQHEMEHLSGTLFWDNLSSVKRNILKRKFKKLRKEADA